MKQKAVFFSKINHTHNLGTGFFSEAVFIFKGSKMHGGIDEYQASGPALGMFATAYTVPFNAQTVLETFDLQTPGGSSTSSLLSGITAI